MLNKTINDQAANTEFTLDTLSVCVAAPHINISIIYGFVYSWNS